MVLEDGAELEVLLHGEAGLLDLGKGFLEGEAVGGEGEVREVVVRGEREVEEGEVAVPGKDLHKQGVDRLPAVGGIFGLFDGFFDV